MVDKKLVLCLILLIVDSSTLLIRVFKTQRHNVAHLNLGYNGIGTVGVETHPTVLGCKMTRERCSRGV